MKHFDKKEFACPCCGVVVLSDEFAKKIDAARDDAGVPFKINSGYRCKPHNKAVGGSDTSSHRIGVACDISCDNSRDRFKIIRGLIRAGIKRIGIAKTFIHADDDRAKSPEVVWLY